MNPPHSQYHWQSHEDPQSSAQKHEQSPQEIKSLGYHTVWDPYLKKDIIEVEKVQIKAACFVTLLQQC